MVTPSPALSKEGNRAPKDAYLPTYLLRTSFLAEHPEIISLTLQAPYVLHVDHSDGGESVPLDQSGQRSGYLRVCNKEPSVMIVVSETKDSQHLWGVLDQGLRQWDTPEQT